MSRVGKKIIPVPKGVQLTLSGRKVTAKGPKGELSYTVHECIGLDIEADQATVTRNSEEREVRALHGLSRALINNLVEGVANGFSKTLEIIGTGYRAQVQGKTVVLNLGYSHPIEFALPDGIEAKIDGNKLTISGIDKQRVGQVAAEIRRLRPPEPYKGKGVRYENEYVRRKAGKSAGA
jgi:large subunit ribosomal protein L6